MSKSNLLGMAVVGCGRISKSHLAAVRSHSDLARLVAVVDQDAALAEKAGKAYGAETVSTSLDDILRRSDVHAVAICLPNDLHAPVAIAAAKAGKHILVEKPMATNASDALAMAKAADENGVTLAIGQCRRYFNAIETLRRRQQEFGDLISIQVSLGVYWDGPQADWWRDPKRANGLVIALNGPHVLDFVQMMMGGLPSRVHAESVRRKSFWGGEDEAMIMLAYPGSRLATVHLSFNQKPVEDRKVLVFENGTAVLEADRKLTFNGEILVEPGADEQRHYLDEAVEFSRQFREFVLATRGEPNRAVLADEGVDLIRTLDAVFEAFKSGQSVRAGASQ